MPTTEGIITRSEDGRLSCGVLVYGPKQAIYTFPLSFVSIEA